MTAGEFAVGGFGVADLVWIAWRPDPDKEDFTAVSLQKQLRRRQLYAFEAKLKDWQRALHQAFRYRYFADKAIVLMPAELAGPAIIHLDTFKQLKVGLWTLDQRRGVIRKLYTPTKVQALNPATREKAIARLSSKINLRKISKQAKTCVDGFKVGTV